MVQFQFSRFDDDAQFTPQSADRLFDQFSEYLMQYGEDLLDNLNQWEETDPDVVKMLEDRGYIEKDREGKYHITPKAIRRMQSKSLEDLFNVNRKSFSGKHETQHRGPGQVNHEETKPYEFGDPISNLNFHETLQNAWARQGGGIPIGLSEEDLVIQDTEYQTSTATVVLIDMSGSMSRYGKYAAAKKVALALQGMVNSQYQGDSLQFVGFYSYASQLTEKQLVNSAPKQVSIFDPRVYLTIDLNNPPGFIPEHFTNIHAGLQFARKLLKRQPQQNRQIIVITDGEPTAHLEGNLLKLIYPPSEPTAHATLAEAKRCADEGIHVSSFALIEDYFYYDLANFVERMAQVTGGISATCNADDMGNMIIRSFVNGRKPS